MSGRIRNFLNGQDVGDSYGSPGASDEGRHILTNGELNLGRLVDVPPRIGGLIPLSSGIGEDIRILELRGDSKLAEFVTISFNYLPEAPSNVASGVSAEFGPCVGIVEFGNGSGFNRVEVDIQQGNALSSVLPASSTYANGFILSPGGTCVSVPASSIRVYARNEGGYQPLGDGDQIGAQRNIPKIMAHAAYGQKPAAELNTRSVWMTGRTAQAAGFTNTIGVPAFARSFTINRVNVGTSALSIYILDQYGDYINGPIAVAAGTDCPSIRLSGIARMIQVTTASASATLLAVFNIVL